MDNYPERCLCGDCATCGRRHDDDPERIERRAAELLDDDEWRNDHIIDLVAEHHHLLLAALDEAGSCWDALTEIQRLLEACAVRCAENELS